MKNYFLDAVIAIACVSLAYVIFFAYHSMPVPASNFITILPTKRGRPTCRPDEQFGTLWSDAWGNTYTCRDGEVLYIDIPYDKTRVGI